MSYTHIGNSEKKHIMKRSFILLAAAALTLAACNCKTEQDNQNNQEVKPLNNQSMEFKKVEERTNMGAKLYVTPQPASYLVSKTCKFLDMIQLNCFFYAHYGEQFQQ